MRGKPFFRFAVPVYLLIGCGPEDCSPTMYSSYDTGGSSQGCGSSGTSGGCRYGSTPSGQLGALSQGYFEYSCPSDGSDAWCLANGVLLQSLIAQAGDGSADAGDAEAGLSEGQLLAAFAAIKAVDGGAAILNSIEATLPDVLIGAPFQLTFTGGLTPAALPPAPVRSVAGGSALTANVWAAYAVTQGPDVVDYVHLHARPMASLQIVVGALGASRVTLGSLVPGPRASARRRRVGACRRDGLHLCELDVSIATVDGKGASASMTAVARGSVRIDATCAGVSGSATVLVEPPHRSMPVSGTRPNRTQSARMPASTATSRMERRRPTRSTKASRPMREPRMPFLRTAEAAVDGAKELPLPRDRLARGDLLRARDGVFDDSRRHLDSAGDAAARRRHRWRDRRPTRRDGPELLGDHGFRRLRLLHRLGRRPQPGHSAAHHRPRDLRPRWQGGIGPYFTRGRPTRTRRR